MGWDGGFKGGRTGAGSGVMDPGRGDACAGLCGAWGASDCTFAVFVVFVSLH